MERARSDTPEKFLLRMPADVKRRLEEAAAANRRSMNSEILAILEKALITDGDKVERDRERVRRAIVDEIKIYRERIDTLEKYLETDPLLYRTDPLQVLDEDRYE